MEFIENENAAQQRQVDEPWVEWLSSGRSAKKRKKHETATKIGKAIGKGIKLGLIAIGVLAFTILTIRPPPISVKMSGRRRPAKPRLKPKPRLDELLLEEW